jgi:membrane protein
MNIGITVRKVGSFLKDLFNAWNEGKTWIYAAALSFFTLFSLAPLLIIAIAVGGFIVGQSTSRQEILKRVDEFAGQQATHAVQQVLLNISETNAVFTAGILSLFAVLLGASGVFWQLRIALNTIMQVDIQRNVRQTVMAMIRTQLLAFALSLGTGLLVIVSLAMGTVISALSTIAPDLGPADINFWKSIETIVSWVLITLLFSLVYQYVPEKRIPWRDALVGGAFAAVLFMIGKILLELYLSTTTMVSVYGAAGSLVILMIWIYYSAAILLLGAEFMEVFHLHRQPEES